MRQRCEITLFVFIIFILFFSNVFAGGGVYWQENGIQVCSYLSGGPKNVFDGKRSAIIVWRDDRNIDAYDDIYGQRIDIDGNFIWQVDGVPVAVTSGPLNAPSGAISDGKGGIITVWEDGRQWIETDIYAQRVDSLGNRLWGSAGAPVCVADSERENPSIVSDGEGGAIIVWEDGRSGYDSDIYAQRIDSSGVPQWQYNGVPVCTLQSVSYLHKICEAPQGVIIVYADTRNGPWWINSDIFAQYIDRDGNILWDNGGVPICTLDSVQTIPEVASSGDGAIIVWNDNRNGNWDIYAQRIRSDGSFAWAIDGIPICADSGIQGGYGTGNKIKILGDGHDGAFIMWDDRRYGSHDIYMQRIDSLGQVYWQENGVYICTAADSAAESISIEAVSDEKHGVIIAWTGWSNIYAQRVDSLGVCQWDSNGVPVCEAPMTQMLPAICEDGQGGAIISWQDKRAGATTANVYAQRVGDNAPSVEEWRNQRQGIKDQGLLILHPNPFTQTMRVEYVVNSQWSTVNGESKTRGHFVVSLKIYDISGRLIRTLVDGVQSSGIHSVEWDGNNEDGIRVKPGIYYVRLRTFHFEETKKIIYIR